MFEPDQNRKQVERRQVDLWTNTMTQAPPVPKPRARYSRDSLGSVSSLDRDPICQNASDGVLPRTDEDPPAGSPGLQTLAGVADIPPTDTSDSAHGPPIVPDPSSPPSMQSMVSSIKSSIPSLAGTADTIANTSSPPSIQSMDMSSRTPSLDGTVSTLANSAVTTQSSSTSSPSSIQSMVSSIANHTPSLDGTASTTANPAVTAQSSSIPSPSSIQSVVSSIANHTPSLDGTASTAANPVVTAQSSSTSSPSSIQSVVSSIANHTPSLDGTASTTANPAVTTQSSSTSSPSSIQSMVSSIANHTPSLDGTASTTANPVVTAQSSSTSSPSSIQSMVSSIANHTPSLDGTASTTANPAVTTQSSSTSSPSSIQSMVSSIANHTPSLDGTASTTANPAVTAQSSSISSPSSIQSMVSSIANHTLSLDGTASTTANPAVTAQSSSISSPSSIQSMVSSIANHTSSLNGTGSTTANPVVTMQSSSTSSHPPIQSMVSSTANRTPSLTGTASTTANPVVTMQSSSTMSPPSIQSMVSSIANRIPSLDGTASTTANPAVTTQSSSTSSLPSIQSMVSSIANRTPNLDGTASTTANPAVTTQSSSTSSPSSIQSMVSSFANRNPSLTGTASPTSNPVVTTQSSSTSSPSSIQSMVSSFANRNPSLTGTASPTSNPVVTTQSSSTLSRPSIQSMVRSIVNRTTSSDGTASTTANPAVTTQSSSTSSPPSIQSMFSSIANRTSLAGTLSTTANPAVTTQSSSTSSRSSIRSMVRSIASRTPNLSGTTGTTANPAVTTQSSSTSYPPSIQSMVTSIASRIPSLAGTASTIANPAVSTESPPSLAVNAWMQTRPPQPLPPFIRGDSHTDVLVAPSSQPQGDAGPAGQEKGKEGLYLNMLDGSDDDVDSDSSNEVSSGPNEQMTVDFAHNRLNNNNVISNLSASVIPPQPVPPAGQSAKKAKYYKQKIPSIATIRVSRTKGQGPHSIPQSGVARASWLETWKGFRHYVFWGTFDGQLMSLQKKRKDYFSEILFHVSSITNIKKLDKRRFSVYFKKKHYDFMAPSDDIQEGWVQSLLASRGQPSPAAPELHGQINIKDIKSRNYAAVCGHDFWVYPDKDRFQLGLASYSIPLNLASVTATGKHSFSMTTPFKTIHMSVDSSKDLKVWLDGLFSSISSALSSSQVATRLWKNPSNQQCADCSAANPEWASINLLLVICDKCAGHHRSLGSTLSNVRSLKMDNKVWTEPLVQLFVTYGNRLANQVWAPLVPVFEQLRPESSDEQRSNFIQDKYRKGRYRRVHALASSSDLMQQRMREVVCGSDVEETMALICSGAKVCQSDPQSPSPIQLAERAGQALQAEILKLNEYTEVPPCLPKIGYRRADSVLSGEEEEELHGKLEDDRFLFSLENDSAACDVLDLRDVLSLFRKDGPTFQFELVTLDSRLVCVAESEDELLTHLVHILKVILPGGVSYAEVCGALAVSKVCVVEVGLATNNPDAWLLLWDGGVSVHRAHRHSKPPLIMELSTLSHHEVEPSEDAISMVSGDRGVSLHFDEHYSCHSWYHLLQDALANQNTSKPPAAYQSLYPIADIEVMSSVPLGIERCIKHIQDYGLKVEGVYRRCGRATKVSQLVEALVKSPSSASLESDEQGVLDVASALKQYIRQREALFPEKEKKDWRQAAVISDEEKRWSAYRQLLQQLPGQQRATLDALFGHFYMVQTYSQVNKMSAQNLALVLVPSLFNSLSADLLNMTREFIIHHEMLFPAHKQHRR
ncbi:mucin-5AC isoform X2 [Entelurus aequoreus]|uniref:mucin-5AC isoform X2 n=1 Tax=Entelurus aequoreus TaxID=161455 RepID=UPI002B1E60A5|nr:mucin-5AC isoform X2 [Entelurus aequoreus]